MKLLISEVLQKVSNAKTKTEKIQLLHQYNTDTLRAILIWNFDESVVTLVPPGEVPYTQNEAPAGTEHTNLEHESRLFYHFIKGGNDSLTQVRREQMFIQLLEGLHKDEAQVICMVKDKQLGKRYKITKNVVAEAFPQIVWGGRS
ncbi:hypothetical protein EB001_04970 [bacterium]|nr:hypothetical protein [bacterium]